MTNSIHTLTLPHRRLAAITATWIHKCLTLYKTIIHIILHMKITMVISRDIKAIACSRVHDKLPVGLAVAAV
jgi:hypothetical protein